MCLVMTSLGFCYATGWAAACFFFFFGSCLACALSRSLQCPLLFYFFCRGAVQVWSHFIIVALILNTVHEHFNTAAFETPKRWCRTSWYFHQTYQRKTSYELCLHLNHTVQLSFGLNAPSSSLKLLFFHCVPDRKSAPGVFAASVINTYLISNWTLEPLLLKHICRCHQRPSTLSITWDW